MKRIGILTLYLETYNYGAQLQAYALQKSISNMGFECEQIRFRWYKQDTKEGYYYASIDYKAFTEFSNSIPHSEKVYDADTIHEVVDLYDVFICGSDQVWGVENSMPIYKLPVMTLSFVPDNKIKIAYAASLGGSIASEKIEEVLSIELPHFDAVSVREKSSVSYIEKLYGKKTQTVLDPVMLLDKSELDTIVTKADIEEDYLFFYCIGLDTQLEEYVELLANKRGLQIVKVGYVDSERISPDKFVGLIKDACLVVTNSFHATVISILYEKNFVCTPVDKVESNKSRNTRMIDLLVELNLTNRYIDFRKCNNIEYLERVVCDGINYSLVNDTLEALRDKSYRFLYKNISIDKMKELYINDSNECTGCGLCSLICPNDCISMQRDRFGFVYPKRNEEHCVHCGKCMHICKSKLKLYEDYQETYYGLESSSEEIRRNSSSGGAFFQLAKHIIMEHGLVYACRYSDRFDVVHSKCESVEELDNFCRSKYVQSNAYEVFEEIKNNLYLNKKILFVGTPCQVESLKVYLGREVDNLITVDLICGGVTAPGLWDMYLERLSESPIAISMRAKCDEYLNDNGYPAFSMKISLENKEVIHKNGDDLFLGSRLSFYRESCYSCKYKGIKRNSDITIGDFCGMKELMPEKYDGKGTTLAIVHSIKGEMLLQSIDELRVLKIDKCMETNVVMHNRMISYDMKRKPQQEYLRCIYNTSDIYRIFYENRVWDEFICRENYQRALFVEVIRNNLMLKLERFIRSNLWIDDDPDVFGDIYIYGAGKLGRSMLLAIKDDICGFIDGNTIINRCAEYRVFHCEDDSFIDRLNEAKEVSVIVTPIWDWAEIVDLINRKVPHANVVSLDDIIGSVWI